MPAALTRGSTGVISQQTCCKISSLYSAVLAAEKSLFEMFSPLKVFLRRIGGVREREFKPAAVGVGAKSLIWSAGSGS